MCLDLKVSKKNTNINKVSEIVFNFYFKLIDYVKIENSLGHLSNLIKRFYLFSIGFEQIYYGIKNRRRLNICILITILMWFVTLYHIQSVESMG